jgi:glutathione S-transferase
MAEATLYSIPGSHPAMAVRLMLERKGIPYRRVDLLPALSRVALFALRFPAVTVPALRIDGKRISGSREISRELERIRPEPPLFPADPAERVAVEDAERWGEEVLQPAARRILWWALARDREAMASYAAGARLGVPVGLAVKTAAPVVRAELRINQVSDERVRADLAALPGYLRRIDDWLADETMGHRNAADYQIATSLRLLMTLDDLRPHLASRPAGELALELVPDYPGRVGPILPEPWLEPLAAADGGKRSSATGKAG